MWLSWVQSSALQMVPKHCPGVTQNTLKIKKKKFGTVTNLGIEIQNQLIVKGLKED